MKFAVVNCTAAGDTTIITGTVGKKIRVYFYNILSSAAVAVTFKSGSTAITGPMTMSIGSAISMGGGDSVPAGLLSVFETQPGESLVLNLSGIATVGGHITYHELAV